MRHGLVSTFLTDLFLVAQLFIDEYGEGGDGSWPAEGDVFSFEAPHTRNSRVRITIEKVDI